MDQSRYDQVRCERPAQAVDVHMVNLVALRIDGACLYTRPVATPHETLPDRTTPQSTALEVHKHPILWEPSFSLVRQDLP